MKDFCWAVTSTGKIATVALLFVVSLLSVGPSARAQVSTASIAGTVQDFSGAIIKGAQVRATQTDAQVVHTATSAYRSRYFGSRPLAR